MELIPRSPLSNPFLNQNLILSLLGKNPSATLNFDLAQKISHPLPLKQVLWALPKATFCHRFPHRTCFNSPTAHKSMLECGSHLTDSVGH